MNRDEAIRLLSGGRKGVDEWNRRRAAGEKIPQLAGTNLENMDLSSADLNGVNLMLAELNGANLSSADLHGAKLIGARIKAADLQGANLTGADLSGATLMGADLDEANLTNAVCVLTVIIGVDFSKVKGLDSVRTVGSTTMGPDAIIDTVGWLSEQFQARSGRNLVLTFLPPQVGSKQKVKYHPCFISYSSKDEVFAKRLYTDLTAEGVRCWFAPKDLKIGAKIRVDLDKAIRDHEKMLLILSRNSVANDWVEKEAETAFEHERREKQVILFPIRLDQAVMKLDSGWAADIKRSRNIGDFRKWKNADSYREAFGIVLRDLAVTS